MTRFFALTAVVILVVAVCAHAAGFESFAQDAGVGAFFCALAAALVAVSGKDFRAG